MSRQELVAAAIIIASSDSTADDRIAAIMTLDPEWGSAIVDFVASNPEFAPYLKYSALSKKSEIPATVKSAKDMLSYYVCCAGVRYDYGLKAYGYVVGNELDKLSDKKRTIIQEIAKLTEIKTTEQLAQIRIKGVGPGAISFVRAQHFDSLDEVYPTDRSFQWGLAKVYGLPRSEITVSKARRLSSNWKGKKAVGSMLCVAALHYA